MPGIEAWLVLVPVSTACLGVVTRFGLRIVIRSLLGRGRDGLCGLRCPGGGCVRQGAGSVLVGADLVHAAADEGPARATDGKRDFADGGDVADGSDRSSRS